MKKLVYLASASRGDRACLHSLAMRISNEGFMVFAPCLGWHGTETEQVRSRILNSGLDVLRRCGIFVGFYEGVKTAGLWTEYDLSSKLNIPRCVFTQDMQLGASLTFPVISSFVDLKEWLHGLQKNS
jgi:hypothetical protein